MKKVTKIILSILGFIVVTSSIVGGVIAYQLYQPIDVDVFEYVTIKQTGGNNEVEIEVNVTPYAIPTDNISKEASKRLNQFLMEVQISQDKKSELKNGDVVTFNVESVDELADKHGIQPLYNEKQYTIKDAPTVPRKWEDFAEFESLMLADSYNLMEKLKEQTVKDENENTQSTHGKDIINGFTLSKIEVFVKREDKQEKCIVVQGGENDGHGCGEIVFLFYYEADLINRRFYYTAGNSFFGFSEFTNVFKTVDGKLEYNHLSAKYSTNIYAGTLGKTHLLNEGYESTGIFL